MKQITFILFFFFFTSFCKPAQEPALINLTDNKIIQLGYWKYLPDSSYSIEEILSKDIKSREITLSGLEKFPNGIHWIKKDIRLTDNYDDKDILALSFFNLPVAYEVYWDGSLIGNNGVVGTSEELEEGGKARFDLNLSKKIITPGNHSLVIRFSNFNESDQFLVTWIQIGYLSAIESLSKIETTEQAVYMGLFFAATLFCISLFMGGWKHPSFLFFGGFSFFYFLVSLWLFLLEGKVINILTYRIFEPLFLEGHTIALIFINYFILSFFETKKKWVHLVPLISIFIAINIMIIVSGLQAAKYQYLLLFGYGLVLVLSKLKHKISGYYFLLTAITLNFIFHLYITIAKILLIPLDYYFFMNLSVNIIFVSLIIIAISRKIQERNKKYQETLVLSHRLESALLKKSIQPHFIMNTLLSLKSWLLKDGNTAEKIIDALANQFRIINKISAEKEITIEEEIELCKLHLELMGYRFTANYEFVTEGNYCGQKIPPLIFHTLVENALTHSYLPKENGTFKFSFENGGKTTRYKLTNNGSQITMLNSKPNEEINEGMGFKYVKSRLEENFPGRWSLNYGLFNNNWEVEIILT